MLQRCLIALAIAGNAKLVIADEPTTALDAIHRDKAVEQFLHLQEQGSALLIVTHDFDVARHIGGHVLIMKEGRMVEQGSAKEVLQNPKAGYTRAVSYTHLDVYKRQILAEKQLEYRAKSRLFQRQLPSENCFLKTADS